jgi:hypothetical protein
VKGGWLELKLQFHLSKFAFFFKKLMYKSCFAKRERVKDYVLPTTAKYIASHSRTPMQLSYRKIGRCTKTVNLKSRWKHCRHKHVLSCRHLNPLVTTLKNSMLNMIHCMAIVLSIAISPHQFPTANTESRFVRVKHTVINISRSRKASTFIQVGRPGLVIKQVNKS